MTDAQEDGKILDDLGKILTPIVPSIPDEYLPFPGAGEGVEGPDPVTGLWPYDPNWGDTPETAADPGVVCDPELAANLGVPVAESCSTDHGPADTWGTFGTA